MATTEAPYSFNVKCYDRNGYDAMFTIRDEDGRQFFQRVTNLLNWLPANGHTPTGQRSAPATNGAAPQAAAAPVCQYHGPMKPSNFGGYYCPKKLHDGSYCTSKSDGIPQAAPQPNAPMPQGQAVQYAANAAPPLFDDGPPPDQYYNES